MSSHFMVRCRCGNVLQQCRCPGPKEVRVSAKPCVCVTPAITPPAEQPLPPPGGEPKAPDGYATWLDYDVRPCPKGMHAEGEAPCDHDLARAELQALRADLASARERAERAEARIVSVETAWSEACKAEARDCGCWGRIMDLRAKWGWPNSGFARAALRPAEGETTK